MQTIFIKGMLKQHCTCPWKNFKFLHACDAITYINSCLSVNSIKGLTLAIMLCASIFYALLILLIYLCLLTRIRLGMVSAHQLQIQAFKINKLPVQMQKDYLVMQKNLCWWILHLQFLIHGFHQIQRMGESDYLLIIQGIPNLLLGWKNHKLTMKLGILHLVSATYKLDLI